MRFLTAPLVDQFMLGMEMPGMPGQGAEREPEPEKKEPGVKDLLKGLFGR